MYIVRRPIRLIFLSLLMFFAVPIYILNIWVVKKAKFIEFLSEGNWIYVALVFGWAFFSFFWIYRGRWRGFWAAWLLSGVLLWGNLYFLVRTRNYALAFYALFILTVSISYLLQLYKTLKEPFYSSGKKWFEGLPTFLPNVEAVLEEHLVGPNDASPKDPDNAKLCRLSVDGCFLYLNSPSKVTVKQLKKIKRLTIKSGDNLMNCKVRLISVAKEKQNLGAGFQFMTLNNMDQQKEVKDFIDRVRSYGYV